MVTVLLTLSFIKLTICQILGNMILGNMIIVLLTLSFINLTICQIVKTLRCIVICFIKGIIYPLLEVDLEVFVGVVELSTKLFKDSGITSYQQIDGE